MSWRLCRAEISNLLGFQGRREWAFEGGLQVLEAPNHTGKTSLTLAVLWALTGTIPGLWRINKQSFRLSNRHAGSEAEQFCRIELCTGEGRKLAVRRLYTGARPDPDQELAVEVDDAVLSGQQAQERIWSELNMKPESLQGCGVVLQDYRLGFIEVAIQVEAYVQEVVTDRAGNVMVRHGKGEL